MYADQHFEQIKVYNQLTPEMLKAIAGEAHARGNDGDRPRTRLGDHESAASRMAWTRSIISST